MAGLAVSNLSDAVDGEAGTGDLPIGCSVESRINLITHWRREDV